MKTRSSNPALRRSDTAGEDKELAAFLTAELDKVLSASHEPRPRCPRCGGSHITSAGFRTRPIGRLPMFACQTCRRYFSRTAAPHSARNISRNSIYSCPCCRIRSRALMRANRWAAYRPTSGNA
ncbi:putative DNA-binding domain protein [Burkholderia pseudomallei MSHR5569]|nr:putative DNA-binding domain protein [Burkholderia pseudomallei MSHR5569]